MKKIHLILFFPILLIISGNVAAATVLNDSWSNVVAGKCSDQTTGWWSSSEALRITENVLLYQKDCGGWPKNTNMQLVLTDTEKAALIADKPKNTDATIDNGACKYELLFLSKVNSAITDATLKDRIRTAFLKGINYYLTAQYTNGGWPQFYPLRTGYYTHITYNDDAIYNVLENLRHVYLKDSYYSIIAPDNVVQNAKTAFDKGIQCILKTQYIQNFKLTTWCAQHDEKTLLPTKARAYELPSLSGAESSNLIKMLMSLDNPTKEIKRAIYSAVYWYDKVSIKGQRLESFTNTDGLSDLRVVADPTAADMWARFYTLENNTPFFCDRDGIMKYSLAEIGYERRNGYSWYNTTGNNVTSNKNIWLPKWGTTVLVSPLPNIQATGKDVIPVIAYMNKYKGSTIKKVDLFLNSTVIRSYSAYTIDTTLTALKAGNYTLMINAEFNNGEIESDTVQFVVTGTTEIPTVQEEKNPRLFCLPHQAGNGLTLKSIGFEMEKVEIYAIQGLKLFECAPKNNTLEIQNNRLPSGVYVVKATDSQHRTYSEKIILTSR